MTLKMRFPLNSPHRRNGLPRGAELHTEAMVWEYIFRNRCKNQDEISGGPGVYSGWEIHGRLLRKAWTPAAKVNGWDEMSGGLPWPVGWDCFKGWNKAQKKATKFHLSQGKTDFRGNFQ